MDIKYYLQAGETHISNLLLKNYQKIGMDTLELLVYIQLQMYQTEKLEIPDPYQISQNLGVDINIVYSTIDRLLNKNIIELEEVIINNKKSNYYNLLPVYDKLNLITNNYIRNEQTLQQIIMKIEDLLGRTLSSNELIQMKKWDELYSKDLIILAMKEAILKEVRQPFSYTDKILQDWQNKKITTVEEATQEIMKFRNTNTTNQQVIEVPIHKMGE